MPASRCFRADLLDEAWYFGFRAARVGTTARLLERLARTLRPYFRSASSVRSQWSANEHYRMPPPEEVAKIKNELKKLESALEVCTDSRIRILIEICMEEWRSELAEAEKLRR
jgi:hypothetical protein